MTPRAWLAAGRVPAAQRQSFLHAMGAPGCWPRDPSLAAEAHRLGAVEPPGPAPGDALLLSVAAHEDRATLWRLVWNDRRSPPDAPFRAEAHASLLRACALARGVSPHLHTLRPLEDPPRGAAQVFKRGRGADVALDDVSFGLSLLLAAVSALTDRPLSPRVVATAALGDDGALVPVAGLAAKLSLVADAALGVDTVLVADSQRDEAPAAWGDEGRARAVVEALFSLCREATALPDWRAVERSARWLTARFAPSTRWCTRARFAALVAGRHANGDAVAMRWEDFVTPGSDHARQLAAHVLQAAADAGLDELPSYVERARSLLPHEPDEPSALALLGAFGRALAALRRYDEAAAALSRATRAWLDSTTPQEASYPLAEWLRVAALGGDDAAWAEAASHAEAYLTRVDRSHFGVSFVRATQGRALGLRGDGAAALAVLDGVAWDEAPAWLRRATWRARALALDGLGRRAEADTLRRALAGDTGDRAEVEAAFAALDGALARGDDPSEALDAALATRPQGVRWLLEGAASTAERARRLAREYPY